MLIQQCKGKKKTVEIHEYKKNKKFGTNTQIKQNTKSTEINNSMEIEQIKSVTSKQINNNTETTKISNSIEMQ